MRLTKLHWVGIILGGIIALASFIFFNLLFPDQNLFFFLLGIGIVIIGLPFLLDLMIQGRRDEQINEMFLEFCRNLAESVNTGTPVSKSIINVRDKNYGALTENVKKLANQIELGVPAHRAFQNFASDVDNVVINRAIALIMEAERAGGEIDYILESVANSISEIEKLKKERKSVIYSLVVQGYIIFFVFIGIMLVMQFNILPLTAGLGIGGLGAGFGANSFTSTQTTTTTGDEMSIQDISNQFLFLLLTQGFFAVLIIGKLSEGTIKAGLKHSFVLVVAAFLIYFGALLAFG